jgi:DNA-binding CsgD family transcriptional regulator
MSKREADGQRGAGIDAAILALHAAIDNEGLWRGVLKVLRTGFSAQRVTLFLGHLGLAEARVVFTDPPIKASAEWYRERARLNPFSRFIESNIGRTHYHFHEVVGTPEAFRKSAFYARFARAEGWDKGLSVMFWNQREMRAMFSLYRAPDQPEFSPAEREAVLALARHIEIAIIRVQKINREENFRSALQAFTRNIPAPVLLLDWSLSPVFANLAAHESAAVWNLGRAEAARINPRDCFRVPAAVIAAARQLKRSCMADPGPGRSRLLPDPVTIRHPGIPELQARINTAHYPASAIARPGFVVLFQEPLGHAAEASSASGRFTERALQELTPAERKVVAQVLTGKRNAAIAASLGKSTLTVKTQLNSIFHKLGIRSRTELIARMR